MPGASLCCYTNGKVNEMPCHPFSRGLSLPDRFARARFESKRLRYNDREIIFLLAN
jgi:hypothetical protein